MKYFVSSDVHGFYNEWIYALNEKGFDFLNNNHKIIICGDLFDRGRQPKEIIDFILSNKQKFILIKGNHEELMEEMIARNKNNFADISNGTTNTIIDLFPDWMITECDLKKIANQTRLSEVLSMCQNYHETKNHIFVHGWIPTIESCGLYDEDWRKASDECWRKSRWVNPVDMFEFEIFDPCKTIVCGHWHVSKFWHEQNPDKYEEFGSRANFNPFVTKHMIALDACTAYSKKVDVVIIDDELV